MNAADRAWMQRIEDKLDQLLAQRLEVSFESSGNTMNVPITLAELDVETGEILAPTPTGRPKRVTKVTEEFREEMVLLFPELGGVADVNLHIDEGIAHKSHAKWDGKQQHIRNWLRKAVEYRQVRLPAAGTTYEDRQEQEQAKHRSSLGRRVIGRVQE